MENLRKLAKQMRCGLYVDFGTDLESAFNAANILAGASREPAAVFTALYGVVNTLCNVIEQEANNVNKKLEGVRDTLEEAHLIVGMIKNYIEQEGK